MMATINEKKIDEGEMVKKLHAAMKQLGTSEDKLIDVLTTCTNKQIQGIRSAYKKAYGSDLVEEIEKETSVNFKRTLVGLTEERFEYRARLLREAKRALGFKNRRFIDILAPLDAKDIAKVKAEYKKRYDRDLEEDVESCSFGNTDKTLVAILNEGRPSDNDVDQELAKKEAKILYEAGQGQWGTETYEFRTIFCTRSWAQLKATLMEYNKQREGTDIETALQEELSGNAEKLYLAIARRALDEERYYANILKDCTAGFGTDDNRLIYTLILQCEDNLSDIKKKYEQLYRNTLAVDVDDDTSGDYRKALMAIIRGNAKK